MKISKDTLVARLDAVSAGLTKNDLLEQSSCFVFERGRLRTFSDEVACSMPSPFGDDIEGAVPAKQLIEILVKMPDDEVSAKRTKTGISVKGANRSLSVRCHADIRLPEFSEDMHEWNKLPKDFCEGLQLVSPCAGKDEARFLLNCVHMTPQFAETTDNYQAARYVYERKMRLRDELLVKRDALSPVGELGVTEFCVSDAWINFRNSSGLVYSCRKYVGAYGDLGEWFTSDGNLLEIPEVLKEVADRAAVMAKDNDEDGDVLVKMKPGAMMIEGESERGRYQEVIKAGYRGDRISFMASPKMLRQLSKRAKECSVTEDRMMINSGPLSWISMLGVAE